MRVLRAHFEAALHKATLVMKLDFFQFVKVFTHNQALYRPLQRQASQAEMTRRALKANVKVILPSPAWKAWCKELTVPGSAPRRAQLQVLKQGQAVREAIRKRDTEARPKPALKTKKSAAPPLPKSRPTRRTPFRLRNLRPLIRPGRKFKQV